MGNFLSKIRYEAQGSSSSLGASNNTGATVAMYIASKSNRVAPNKFIGVSSVPQFMNLFSDKDYHPSCEKAINLLGAGYNLKVCNVYTSEFQPALRFFNDTACNFEYGFNYPRTEFGFVNSPTSTVRLDLNNIEHGDYVILEPMSKLQNNIFLYFYSGDTVPPLPPEYSTQNIENYENSKFCIDGTWVAKDVLTYLNEEMAAGFYATIGENSNVLYIANVLGIKNVGNSTKPYEFSDTYRQYFNIIDRHDEKVFDAICPYYTDNEGEYTISISKVDSVLYRIKISHLCGNIELSSETFAGQLNDKGPLYPNILRELVGSKLFKISIYNFSPIAIPEGTFVLNRPCTKVTDSFHTITDKHFYKSVMNADEDITSQVDIYYDSGIVSKKFQMALYSLFNPFNTLGILTYNSEIDDILNFCTFFTSDSVKIGGLDFSAAELFLVGLMEKRVQGVVDNVSEFTKGSVSTSVYHVNDLKNMVEVYYCQVLGYFDENSLVDTRELFVKPLLDRRITNYWDGTIASIQSAIMEVQETMYNTYGYSANIIIDGFIEEGDTIKVKVNVQFSTVNIIDSLTLNLSA